jgi:hypothetical protein
LRTSRWKGARLLPYMDDLLFFADIRDAPLQLRDSVAALLDRLGLGRNPKKCHWEPTQIFEHLDLHIRHYELYMPSPSFDTPRHCYPLPDPTATFNTRRPVATRPTTRGPRRKSAIPLPRHPDGSFLPRRTPQRLRYSNMMGGTGKTHLQVETGLAIVDASPLRQQRPLHLLPNRERLRALRHRMIRLGGKTGRAIGSTWVLGSGRPTSAHDMERIEAFSRPCGLQSFRSCRYSADEKYSCMRTIKR